jgi:uncharacterized protein
VHVCTLCPGGVVSNSKQYITTHYSGWFVRQSALHPDDVARLALKGAFQKKAVVIPGILNRILLVLTQMLPVFLKDQLATYSMKSVTTNATLKRLQLYQL